MKTPPSISIVIVTWNCKAFAQECLTSLEAQKGEFTKQIIVVDNASADGTPELIAAQFPGVRLIRSTTNLGFSRANNMGLAEANGDYICLINPDVNVAPNCLRNMLEFMEREPLVGLIGPKMIGADGQVGRSTMRFPTIWNSLCRALGLDVIFKGSRVFGGFLMRDFRHDHTRDVDVLNGWFWMTRRSAMSEVGVLDPQLFMYGDDLDWCRRFHNSHWRVVFFSDAKAIHYGGGTTKKAPIPFYLALQRANLQYWLKHNGRIATAGYFLITCLHHAVRVVGYAVVCLSKKAEPLEATYKVRRSFASILWLTGLGSSRVSEIR